MLSSRSSHELLETKITIHSDDELDDYIRSESIALLRRRNSSELPHRISRLCINLHTYLVIGYRWILRFLALTFYSIFLLPGFVQIGWYYFFSGRVQRGVVYGDKPRNRLDLYLPSKANKSMPVVAFVTGGAWIIGYKAWGALLARQLQERNIIVACIDYRNFPQGSIGDMVKDVSNALSFLLKNAQSYGGDLNRMYLAGQSAGAHIAACTLVGQAQEEASKGQGCVDWSCSQFKAFFGISGCYNLMEVVDHFHSRGLYRSIFLSVMEGERALAKYSPELAIKSGEFDGCAAALLPCMVLLHGKADYSIPYSSSVAFGESLRSVKAKVIMKLYEDKTHTDLILQDPMRGGDDKVVVDIVGVMQDEDEELYVNLCGVSRKRMVPEWCLKLATNLSPF